MNTNTREQNYDFGKNDPDLLPVKKYKARVRHTAPDSAKTLLHQHDQCFLGYSLGNAKFEIPKLEAMANWIHLRFKRCFVLIGDSIYRFTIQIHKEVRELEALEEAYRMRNDVIQKTKSLFSNLSSFEYILCSQVQTWPDYESLYRQIVDFYRTDQKFAKSVNGFAEQFILRNRENSERYLRLSSAYILEEAAIIACMVKKGVEVLIYPGNLLVFGEIANGEHPGAPEELKRLVSIGLGFK